MMLFNKGEKVEIYLGSQFKNAIHGTVMECEDPIYLIVTQTGSRVVTRSDNLKSLSECKDSVLDKNVT
jgi:hypothetical protein